MHLIYNKPFSYTSCYTISFPIPVLVPVSVTAPGGLQIRMLMMGSRSAEEWMSTRKVKIWLWVSTAPMKNEATFDGLSFLLFPFCFFFSFLFIYFFNGNFLYNTVLEELHSSALFSTWFRNVEQESNPLSSIKKIYEFGF